MLSVIAKEHQRRPHLSGLETYTERLNLEKEHLKVSFTRMVFYFVSLDSIRHR